MLSNELAAALQALKRLYGIVWFALTNAIFFYLLVLFLMSGTQSETPAAMEPFVQNLLTVISIATGLTSLFYWHHTRSHHSLQRLMARDIQLQDVEAKASKLIAKSTGDPIVGGKNIGQLSRLSPFDR